MNEIRIFENETFGKIRVTEINNEPWWVLADVCKVLEIGNSRMVASRLDKDELMSVKLTSGRQKREMTVINESGLYAVILRSDKPQAKPFRKWITSEVIPSIRKHGAYMTPQALTQALSTPENLITLLQTLQSEQNKNKELSAEIEVMKPKASYYDLVLNCKDLVPISVIAKDYGKSAIWLNRYLREKKIQYRQGNIWLLYQKYSDKGYASTKTNLVTDTSGVPHVREFLCWSQKGRLFIYKMLKNDGILPLMEHEATA
jgi:prophage antirepressor-like protein